MGLTVNRWGSFHLFFIFLLYNLVMQKMFRLLILTIWLAACSPSPIPATATGVPEQIPTPTNAATQPVKPTLTLGATETNPAPSLTPTPALNCSSPASLTPAMTEGPYYTPNTPERTSLVEANMPGKRLRLTGFVLDQNCQPVAGAFLDFWQADSQGVYDNTGFTLRGHQFTAADGSFILETVVPGEYPGRTEHIHVKVQAPGGEMLTSQLYFPGKNANDSDRIFNEQLLVSILQDSDSMIAEFTFIVP